MTFLTFLILTLAAFRAARLVAQDEITEGIRVWLYNKQWTWLFRLTSCTHCIGVWMAFLAVGVWAWATDWQFDFPESVIIALGVAGGQSAMATVAHKLDV